MEKKILDKGSNLSFFEQTQKEVIWILSGYFIKKHLGINIKTKLFNMKEIIYIYIVLPVLKITSTWRSVFIGLSGSNNILETTN